MTKYIHKYEDFKEVNDSFVEMLRLFYKDLHGKLVIGDHNAQCCDIRCLYCDYIDTIHKEGLIDDDTANNISFNYKG
jgi:hypothetical protein